MYIPKAFKIEDPQHIETFLKEMVEILEGRDGWRLSEG